MTVTGWLTIFFFCGILTALAMPLGHYMAAVYAGERTFMDRILSGPERLLYRIIRVDPRHDQARKTIPLRASSFSASTAILLYFWRII